MRGLVFSRYTFMLKTREMAHLAPTKSFSQLVMRFSPFRQTHQPSLFNTFIQNPPPKDINEIDMKVS